MNNKWGVYLAHVARECPVQHNITAMNISYHVSTLNVQHEKDHEKEARTNKHKPKLKP